MKLNRRQKEILDLARRQGFVAVDALAQRFSVTTQTIRRDVNLLCDQGALRRFHGGAGIPSASENLPYDHRRQLALEEKKRIARLVAEQVPNRASLFIDIGTTLEEVARALMNHTGLRVITNNLQVAQLMSYKTDFEVMIASGTVRSRDRAIVGEPALSFVQQFRVDLGLISCSGLEADGSLLDFDYRKVRISQAMIAQARQVFLAIDSSKFHRAAMIRSAHLSDVDALFTDKPLRDPFAELVTQLGLKAYQASA